MLVARVFVKEIFGELQKSFIPIKETFEFQWRFKIIFEYEIPYLKETPLSKVGNAVNSSTVWVFKSTWLYLRLKNHS